MKTYDEQIVETFRDKAIKSVLLVDDQYLPYEKLVEEMTALISEAETLSVVDEANNTAIDGQHQVQVDTFNKKLKEIRTKLSDSKDKLQLSDLAGKFTEFFHGDQRICDVEDKTNNLDYEKIRKSDLIILDFHLAPNSPDPEKPSLQLVSDLSDSKHLNMVVLFTTEPLDTVWTKLATTLRGSFKGSAKDFFDPTMLRNWSRFENKWLPIFETIFDESEQVQYLTCGNNIQKLSDEMAAQCVEARITRPHLMHLNFMIDKVLNKYNSIGSEYESSPVEVHGKQGLWVQAGDVFVVLCDKFENRDEKTYTKPTDVWEKIREALLDWYPSFYRVVTSQLQNQIEDTNLSMKKALAKDEIEQVAALWGLLRNPDGCYAGAAEDLLSNLLDDIFYKLQDENEFIKFISDTAKNAVGEPSKFIESIGSIEDKKETQLFIAHAHNVQLSTTQDFPTYITTGTIVKDREDVWYLCVTPSCNTVPEQTVRDFEPHRQLTFAKLRLEENLSTVLESAHQSMHVFVNCPKEGRLVFSTVKVGDAGVPSLVKAIVLNHDTGEWDIDPKTSLPIKHTRIPKTDNGELKFIEKQFFPISRLRPAYAARFQNLQSHYEGRIGVDFASFNINENPMYKEDAAEVEPSPEGAE